MQWYWVLYFGILLGFLPVMVVLLLHLRNRNKALQKCLPAIKEFKHQPPILEHCSHCSNGYLYATAPEHPVPDFEEKIKTPRVLCRLGQDPWREEPSLCPDFVRDNSRLAEGSLLTNGDQIF